MARKEYLCKAERSYLYNVGYHKNFPRPRQREHQHKWNKYNSEDQPKNPYQHNK